MPAWVGDRDGCDGEVLPGARRARASKVRVFSSEEREISYPMNHPPVAAAEASWVCSSDKWAPSALSRE
jgi:hypothetical protein